MVANDHTWSAEKKKFSWIMCEYAYAYLFQLNHWITKEPKFAYFRWHMGWQFPCVSGTMMTHGVAVSMCEWHYDTWGGSFYVWVALWWHMGWQCPCVSGTMMTHGVAVSMCELHSDDTWGGSVHVWVALWWHMGWQCPCVSGTMMTHGVAVSMCEWHSNDTWGGSVHVWVVLWWHMW